MQIRKSAPTLDFLSEGMTEAELRAEYSALKHEDVLAAIAYGAEAARERVIRSSPKPRRDINARPREPTREQT